MAAEQPPQEEGFYSSTSGTYFPDKQSLAEHYASDLHRYNLKRKVAGLPPVTKDWFEARKEQLTLSSGGGDVQKVRNLMFLTVRCWNFCTRLKFACMCKHRRLRQASAKPYVRAAAMAHVQVYYDPLTRKKFMSRNAYLNTVNSKKYKDAVRKSGQPAPEPIVRTVTQGPPTSASGATCVTILSGMMSRAGGEWCHHRQSSTGDRQWNWIGWLQGHGFKRLCRIAGKGAKADAQPSPGFKATPAPLSRANAGRSSVSDSVREVCRVRV